MYHPQRATSVEPGSGTTIMSYGYTCGRCHRQRRLRGPRHPPPGAAGPLLNFHTVSLAEANTYLATTSCGTSTSTGTTAPVITTVTTARTIPKSTPFALTGTATGGNGP